MRPSTDSIPFADLRSTILFGLLLAACGGRLDAPADQTILGGATAQTASSSANLGGAGHSSTAVTQSGGSSPTVTMTAACPETPCAPIPADCTQINLNPEGCCPFCVQSACGSCENYACVAGYHADPVTTGCCPRCVPDTVSDACSKGRQLYDELRDQLITKFNAIGCTTSSDCTLVLEDNACGITCGTAFATAAAPSATAHLNTNAANYCASCPPQEQPRCPAVDAPCLNGTCTTMALIN